MIAVDEGQFFSDLFEQVTRWLQEHHCIVIVSSLDGDSNRNQFGAVLQLIPWAEQVDKLLSICQRCGKDAPFTNRTCKQSDQTHVGGEEAFMILKMYELTQSGMSRCVGPVLTAQTSWIYCKDVNQVHCIGISFRSVRILLIFSKWSQFHDFEEAPLGLGCGHVNKVC